MVVYWVQVMLPVVVWCALAVGGVIGTPFREVLSIVDALTDSAPAGLRTEAAWKEWSARRSKEIRTRLVQGDEDSLANLLLLGTTFTSQPRVTGDLEANRGAVQARIADFSRAIAQPSLNERMLFMRRLLEARGYAADDPRLQQYLRDNVKRVAQENTVRSRELQSILRLRSSTKQFAERSTIYRDSGLSVEASLPPNLAIEESLAEMKARGLLAPGSVRRVAVVGPGLDFIDKNEGYDFYPPQTLQPFALIDSLLRLGLSKSGEVEVAALDISPRVLQHLTLARAKAERSFGYVVELPRDPGQRWRPQTVDYWQRFGDQIGSEIRPTALPPGMKLETRAVRIRPSVVLAMRPVEMNIVLQRADPSPAFDLVVATNVFVYYDTFEQSLALRNVQEMLRPGGFLLTNNSLLVLPSSSMRSLDSKSVIYSAKPDDSDQVVWYRKD